MVAALITEGSDITIENVMLNPDPHRPHHTLLEMGGDIEIENRELAGGEEVGDLTVQILAAPWRPRAGGAGTVDDR